MLSSSPKMSDPTESNSFELNLAQKDEKVGSKFFSAHLTSFWVSLTGSLRKSFINKPCYAFKQAHLLESATSEILELSGSFFFFKTLEIYCKFQKCKKNGEKIYGFLDSLIYVGNGKFSLLIREYS